MEFHVVEKNMETPVIVFQHLCQRNGRLGTASWPHKRDLENRTRKNCWLWERLGKAEHCKVDVRVADENENEMTRREKLLYIVNSRSRVRGCHLTTS